ncbi:MAG: hypothetical protein FWG65_04615 [Turicibacter sp.]|nr:hypothetical protein [Turicibacter sp.]
MELKNIKRRIALFTAFVVAIANVTPAFAMEVAMDVNLVSAVNLSYDDEIDDEVDEIEDVDETEDDEEKEDIDEVEDVDDTEEKDDVEDTEDTDENDEIDDEEDSEETDDTEEIDETDESDETDEIEYVDDTDEEDNVDDTDEEEADDTEVIEEVDEIDEIEDDEEPELLPISLPIPTTLEFTPFESELPDIATVWIDFLTNPIFQQTNNVAAGSNITFSVDVGVPQAAVDHSNLDMVNGYVEFIWAHQPNPETPPFEYIWITTPGAITIINADGIDRLHTANLPLYSVSQENHGSYILFAFHRPSNLPLGQSGEVRVNVIGGGNIGGGGGGGNGGDDSDYTPPPPIETPEVEEPDVPNDPEPPEEPEEPEEADYLDDIRDQLIPDEDGQIDDIIITLTTDMPILDLTADILLEIIESGINLIIETPDGVQIILDNFKLQRLFLTATAPPAEEDETDETGEEAEDEGEETDETDEETEAESPIISIFVQSFPTAEENVFGDIVLEISIDGQPLPDFGDANVTIRMPIDPTLLEELNSNRVVALDANGDIVGGRFEVEQGFFEVEINANHNLVIAYVEDLVRLSMHIGLPNVENLTENGEFPDTVDISPILYQDTVLFSANFINAVFGVEFTFDPLLGIAIEFGGESFIFIHDDTYTDVYIWVHEETGDIVVSQGFITQYLGAAVNRVGASFIEIIK